MSGTALSYSSPPGNAAYPAGGVYVKQAGLYIGGTLVKSYYDTSVFGPYPVGTTLGTDQGSVPLSVVFDSTHFADGSAIAGQMTVTDSGGFTYTIPLQANAYNKGYVGYEPTTISGQSNAGVAAATMIACQIADNNSNITDNRDIVLSAVTFNTDFFTCNHGNETPNANNHIYFEPPAGVGNLNGIIFGNQSVDPSSTQASPRDDVAEAVAKKNVTIPPYNFIYMDLCNGALNPEFSNGFGILMGSTDRAFLGWSGVVADNNANLQWTGRLYVALASGSTLKASIAAADTTDPTSGVPIDVNTHSPCLRPVTGDLNMTLHGTVYQGTTGSWFK
jgi:hypothetical protein